jgi:hypothetical protein
MSSNSEFKKNFEKLNPKEQQLIKSGFDFYGDIDNIVFNGGYVQEPVLTKEQKRIEIITKLLNSGNLDQRQIDNVYYSLYPQMMTKKYTGVPYSDRRDKIHSRLND